ncbi:MAG TPA: hypothetical protein VMA71_10130 [Alloacidobacterium sp.]|nr:hypothetical protein [Alloacidobacterium sp.]
MPNYPIHTIASAPEGSKSALEQLRQAFGVIPNLAAASANSPNSSTILRKLRIVPATWAFPVSNPEPEPPRFRRRTIGEDREVIDKRRKGIG